MAISTRVVSPTTPIIGIKSEAVFGAERSAIDSTAYRQLPVTQATKPTFNPSVNESRVTSGNTMADIGDSHHSMKGGNVTIPIEPFWATPKLLAQFLAMAGQNHSETGTAGSEVHTTTFKTPNTIKTVGGTVSNSLPASVNFAYDIGTAGEGIKVCGAVCSELTLAISAGSNANLLSMGCSLYSGHSYPVAGSTTLEESFSGTWIDPEQTYFPLCGIEKKQLKVDGSTVDIVIKDLSFTITPSTARTPGGDSNCNATSIVVSPWSITGSMSFKYDDNASYASGSNVMQDFIGGSVGTLSVQWGDGTVSSSGEMNLDAQLRYTGDPGQDITEGGIFHTVEFVCEPSGTTTAAFEAEIFSGESETAW